MRLTSNVNDTPNTTPVAELTFEGSTLPYEINFDCNCAHPLEPFIQQPTQCTKCLKHGQKSGQSKSITMRCTK